MKYFAIIFYVIILAEALSDNLVNEMKIKVQQFGLECIQSEKPPEDDIMNLMTHKPPQSHEGKCVIFCVNKKFNMMKDNGQTAEGDVEWLKKVKLDDPVFYDIIIDIQQSCNKIVEEEKDFCERALQLVTCGYKEAIKHDVVQYFEL